MKTKIALTAALLIIAASVIISAVTDTSAKDKASVSAPPSDTPTTQSAPPTPMPKPTPAPTIAPTPTPTPTQTPTIYPDRETIVSAYAGVKATKWAETMDGITSVLNTDEKIIALTFDACSGDCDDELLQYLIDEKIPATLFISGSWIEANPGKTELLAKYENLEIENHGAEHKSLSVSGRKIYGVSGTANAGEIYDEIINNAVLLETLTGRKPLFMRDATAYYDEVAVKITTELGFEIAGYTIAADGGATYTAKQIQTVCAAPKNGSILLFHMNHPEKQIAEGVKALIPTLIAKGYTFVKLEEYYNG